MVCLCEALNSSCRATKPCAEGSGFDLDDAEYAALAKEAWGHKYCAMSEKRDRTVLPDRL
jgi:hypothetical protein